MKEWYKRLEIIGLSQTDTKWAVSMLFIFAFTDASFLPLPVSTLFLVLILMDSNRALKYIMVSTLGSIAGGVAGFMIGHFAILNANGSSAGFLQFLFNHIPGLSGNGFNKLQLLYTKWDFWILFTASFTPVPFGIFSISSGLFGINLAIFLLATIISQTAKYFLLAYVTIKLGPQVKMILHFNLKPFLIIASVGTAIVLLVTKII